MMKIFGAIAWSKMLRHLLLIWGGLTLLLSVWVGFLRLQPAPHLPPAGIVFESDGDLFKVNWFGKGLTMLVQAGFDPHILPDGSLTFRAFNTKGYHSIFKLAGNRRQALGPELRFPINFWGSPDGHNFFVSGELLEGLYRIQDNQQTLISSGDVRNVTYGDHQVLFAMTPPNSSNMDLYLVNVDGTELTNLTPRPDFDAYPQLSPDGEWVYFASTLTRNLEIFRMRLDGSELTNLTQHPDNESNPQLTSDGAYLFFIRSDIYGGDIYRLRLADGQIINLTNHPALEKHFLISQDSRWLSVVSIHQGKQNIYRMDIEGGQTQTLHSKYTRSEFAFDYLPPRQLPWRVWLSFGVGLLCLGLGRRRA